MRIFPLGVHDLIQKWFIFQQWKGFIYLLSSIWFFINHWTICFKKRDRHCEQNLEKRVILKIRRRPISLYKKRGKKNIWRKYYSWYWICYKTCKIMIFLMEIIDNVIYLFKYLMQTHWTTVDSTLLWLRNSVYLYELHENIQYIMWLFYAVVVAVGKLWKKRIMSYHSNFRFRYRLENLNE